jgi:hypothetical protein
MDHLHESYDHHHPFVCGACLSLGYAIGGYETDDYAIDGYETDDFAIGTVVVGYAIGTVVAGHAGRPFHRFHLPGHSW